MVEIDPDQLARNAGYAGKGTPGELTTNVPHEYRVSIDSIRSYLLDSYKTSGLKHRFRQHGQDVIGYYSAHKLQILAGAGLASLITAGAIGGFVIYRQRKQK